MPRKPSGLIAAKLNHTEIDVLRVFYQTGIDELAKEGQRPDITEPLSIAINSHMKVLEARKNYITALNNPTPRPAKRERKTKPLAIIPEPTPK